MYPGFQPDDVYDKDYVKDENGDGGEWAAQAKFDELRTKVKKATLADGQLATLCSSVQPLRFCKLGFSKHRFRKNSSLFYWATV